MAWIKGGQTEAVNLVQTGITFKFARDLIIRSFIVAAIGGLIWGVIFHP